MVSFMCCCLMLVYKWNNLSQQQHSHQPANYEDQLLASFTSNQPVSVENHSQGLVCLQPDQVWSPGEGGGPCPHLGRFCSLGDTHRALVQFQVKPLASPCWEAAQGPPSKMVSPSSVHRLCGFPWASDLQEQRAQYLPPKGLVQQVQGTSNSISDKQPDP